MFYVKVEYFFKKTAKKRIFNAVTEKFKFEFVVIKCFLVGFLEKFDFVINQGLLLPRSEDGWILCFKMSASLRKWNEYRIVCGKLF